MTENDDVVSVGTPERDDDLFPTQLSLPLLDKGYIERERARKTKRLSELQNQFKAPIFSISPELRLSATRTKQWEAVLECATSQLVSLLVSQLKEDLSDNAKVLPPHTPKPSVPATGKTTIPSLMEVSIPETITRKGTHSGWKPSQQPSGRSTKKTRRRKRRTNTKGSRDKFPTPTPASRPPLNSKWRRNIQINDILRRNLQIKSH